MESPNVLVIGGPGVGKTHYAGQFLGRLRHDRHGKLRLRAGGVGDLSKVEDVLSCLEEGRAAGHTPGETWDSIRCEIETSGGKDVLLEWPEYAGERLSTIVEQHTIPVELRTSVERATNWILFVRPKMLRIYEDLLERPTGLTRKLSHSSGSLVDGKGWDDRARYVELLQVLLYAAGRSTYHRISSPRLAVVLSCWDELVEPGNPEECLATRLPLVHAFIRSTWQDHAWSVWGLSSLGRALSPDDRDNEFAEKGPENFGFVIKPGATEPDTDLTAPVSWLLEV